MILNFTLEKSSYESHKNNSKLGPDIHDMTADLVWVDFKSKIIFISIKNAKVERKYFRWK